VGVGGARAQQQRRQGSEQVAALHGGLRRTRRWVGQPAQA
jgi:hypothetical protein